MAPSSHIDPVVVLARSGPAPGSVKKAISYMRRNMARKIAMADLVAVCDVAERTLRKHFHRFVGLSPLGFLHRLRLAAVREKLLEGAHDASVTEVASCYGFSHFGRFSLQYRRCFGEAPSVTLGRGRATAESERSGRIGNEGRTRDRPSLAVVACETSAAEPRHRFFAQCLAEGIATALCRVRCICVRVPASSRGTAGHDLLRLGRELGARYVLTGRIAQAGGRVRIIIRLLETTAKVQIWGDSYDGETSDLFRLQDRVTKGVVGAVLPCIRGAEIERARRKRPEDLDVYDLTMRAFPFVFTSNPSATRQALDLLHRALEIDPDYALSTGLAAWCHGQLVMYNGSTAPAQDRACAIRLAQRAAILDNDDALVLTARCAVHTMAREFDAADVLLARALELDPTSGWAWGRSGWLNSYLGNSEVAIDHFRRAISLEPSSPSNANNFVGIGSAQFGAGRYRAAAVWMRKALVEQPGTLWANRTLSVSYARLGERLKALESLETLRRYCPDLTVSRVVDAIPFREDYLDRLGGGLSELGLPP